MVVTAKVAVEQRGGQRAALVCFGCFILHVDMWWATAVRAFAQGFGGSPSQLSKLCHEDV